MFKNLCYFTTVCISFLALNAQASPPYTPDMVSYGNRWTITAYDDSSSIHNQWATQGICFYYAGTKGSQQLYYWVSDTFPDWNGRAAQEGDQVFMHGDYASNIGHDSIEVQLTTISKKDEAFGHWREWREYEKYGRTIGFVNTKLTRVGSCKYKSFLESRYEYLNLELKVNEKGEKLITPFGITEEEFMRIVEEDAELGQLK